MKEFIKNKRKLVVTGLFFMTILINVGFFPMINFNSDNPVNLGITMRMVIVLMALMAHKYVGSLEALVFEDWSIMKIGFLNTIMVLCGLICRFVLEFGEVSNTYNFTVVNVIFQVVVLVTISTFVYGMEKGKQNDR